MHEMAVTEDIMRIVTEHAAQAGAEQITDIHLVIGDMSSFVDDSIQFYFDLLSPETVAEGATLHFHRVEIRFRCRACGAEFSPDGMDWRCPKCDALGGKVIAGKEFYVESIEVT
ncbi:MAG: hydrogenase maturation nickel metallochaperone HypA [Chloroflexi bacterium]|jgi:hydrogenase nickel incorporation protein HypA/HybF|nr:hydrogenase maturation nickel metallochaperone HypA [Chloroflexota bacterium]